MLPGFTKLAAARVILLTYINAALATPIIGGRASACTYAASQVTPTDVPTASIYTSTEGVNYHFAGSQNGMILNGSYIGYITGPDVFPQSNSYELAVQQCSDFCDSYAANGYGQCLSFNIFTAYEADFNDCLPTFECRFNSQVYNAADYQTDNGTPSYAWTLQSLPIPTCPAGQYDPSIWISNGMDDWLTFFSRSQNLLGKGKTGYLHNLMDDLQWYNYDCDSALSSNLCDGDSTTANPCANWINRQARLYFTSMNNILDLLNDWLSNMQNQDAVFQSFFPVANAPSAAGFKGFDFISTAMGVALSVIPYAGPFLSNFFLLATAFAVDDSVYTGPVNTAANQAATLTAFLHGVSTGMIETASGLANYTSQQGSDGSILDMMRGGNYFLDIGDSIEVDSATLWRSYEPVFYTQLGVAAMQAQGVFIMRAQWNIYSTASSCSQAVADQFAQMFSPSNYQNFAWCEDDGVHVMVPLTGYNMDLYRNLNAANQAPMSVSAAQVGNSADECFSTFGPSNPYISPYNTSYELTGLDYLTQIPDLTDACIWPIPVCHFADWKTVSIAQSVAEAGYYYSAPAGSISTATYYAPSTSQMFIDVAGWFAYQLGLRSQFTWCSNFACEAGCTTVVPSCKIQSWSKQIQPLQQT